MLNDAFYLLVYTTNINLVCGNIDNVEENRDAFVVSMKSCLNVDAHKTKCMFLSRKRGCSTKITALG